MANEKDVLQEEVKEEQTAENTDEMTSQEGDEAVLETEAQASEETNDDVKLQEAEAKIAELQAKVEEQESRYLRLQADFDNVRRRANLEKEASVKYRSQSIISDLLPAIDNFERALQMEATEDQAKSLLQGMEMVYRSLIEALQKEGAEQIEAVGQEFDPHIHQAVMQVEDENFGSNIVVAELQKGYKLKDRVIRPAMVKVNM